jgi:hypothetical protein
MADAVLGQRPVLELPPPQGWREQTAAIDSLRRAIAFEIPRHFYGLKGHGWSRALSKPA